MVELFTDMWDGKLGIIEAIKHQIDLESPGAKPVHFASYIAAKQLENKEIEKMLRTEVIKPPQTEWASPMVFLPKKDGSLRFYAGKRHLIALIIRYSYQMTLMEE